MTPPFGGFDSTPDCDRTTRPSYAPSHRETPWERARRATIDALRPTENGPQVDGGYSLKNALAHPPIRVPRVSTKHAAALHKRVLPALSGVAPESPTGMQRLPIPPRRPRTLVRRISYGHGGVTRPPIALEKAPSLCPPPLGPPKYPEEPINVEDVSAKCGSRRNGSRAPREIHPNFPVS